MSEAWKVTLEHAKAASNYVLETLTKGLFRIAIWAATVFISVLPIMIASDLEPSIDLHGMAKQINEAGLYKDLFFVVVIVAMLGITNIFTDLFERGRPNTFYLIIYIASCLAFFYFIVFGVVEFARIASHHSDKFVVASEQFTYDKRIIFVTCILELCVELLLAFRRR